jgi:hypothetical protein
LEVVSGEPYEGFDKEVISEKEANLRLSDAVWTAVSNSYLQVRLKPARDYLNRPTQADIPLMMSIFKTWVQQPEWMLLEGVHCESGEKQRIAVKTSKRGNDVFQRRMERNLGFLREFERIEFFKVGDVERNEAKTCMLWTTWTWDPNRTSLDDAWRSASKEWNLMATKIRKEYGKVSILVFSEAFPDEKGKAWGYPHFHAVLWFHEHEFNVFLNVETDNEGKIGFVYRIKERNELKDVAQWKAYVDIKALRTMDSVIDYCRKHEQGSFALTHNDGSVNKEALTNCTLQWFYHKRTYSVSREFRIQASEFIRHMRNSNWHQATLDGSDSFPVWKWENKGIRSLGELVKCGLNEAWTHDIKDPDVWDRLVRRDYHRESWSID